jgi:methylglutaconyl-CoA hydratase
MIVFETIETTLENQVCTLWLSREVNRNAINGQMAREVIACLDALTHDDQVRVLIIRGKGRAFCAGGDLNWMLSEDAGKEIERPADLLSSLFRELYFFPKPLISYVHGFAMGGALGLVVCADFVLAEDNAFFAFSEVKLGLVPATISPFVVKRIGEFRARQLMLHGGKISSSEARQAGLVDVLVPGNVTPVAEDEKPGGEKILEELAGSLAENAPLAMQTCKRLLTTIAGEPLSKEMLSYTTDLLTRTSKSPEAREGIRAFMEKRKPIWPANK